VKGGHLDSTDVSHVFAAAAGRVPTGRFRNTRRDPKYYRKRKMAEAAEMKRSRNRGRPNRTFALLVFMEKLDTKTLDETLQRLLLTVCLNSLDCI